MRAGGNVVILYIEEYTYSQKEGVVRRTQKPSIETHWKVTMTVALVLALIFFWPLLGAICFAAIMAFLFYPMYRWFCKFLPSVISVVGTLIVSVCVIALPIALVLIVAIAQGVSLASDIAHTLQVSSNNSTLQGIEKIVGQVNEILAPLFNGQVTLSVSGVRNFFADTLPPLIKALVSAAVGFASSFPTLLTFVTVYFFLFIAFLMSGKSILEQLRVISPFNNKTTELYFVRTGGMIKASMLSQLLIAFILSFLTAILLLLLGLGPYFFFLVIVMTLLNMIPLGSGLIVYPIAIIAILLGNVAGGIWVIIIYSFVICNLDNMLRPKLIPKNVQLVPALMTLAVFCGIQYFGILGVVYGPVIAIILLTTFETYIDYKRRMSSG